MRRLLRIALGGLLMILGLVGLVLPVLQGWLLLGMGGLVLAQDIPIFAKMTCRITARFPQTGRTARRLARAFGTLVECPRLTDNAACSDCVSQSSTRRKAGLKE
jgi:hypothetical protein